jgi:O-antigen/teichoic acid export membrane protein
MAPIITRVVYGWAYERAGLPLRIIVWMIPVTWLSGHFRFSLIVSGHQRFEFLASAVAGVSTAALALWAARGYGAEGAATALLAGGIVNAVVSGVAMYVLIGSVRLTPALAPFLVCLASIGIGLAAGRLIGPIAGAAIACGLYIVVTATQWDLSRVQAAWEGRIDAA